MSIASLMEEMAAKGASLDVILMAVRAIEAEQGRVAAERGKAAERKRRQRARTRDSHGTVTGPSRDEAVTTPIPDKEAPQTPKEINPTPGVCIAPARESDPVDRIVASWNAMAKAAGLRAVQKLTAERRGRLRARLAEHGPDAFTEAIAAVERSPFCRGENDRGWRADFDFLLQPRSFTRLIEGSYDRAPASAVGRRAGRANAHPGGRHCAAADDVFGSVAH